MRWGQYMFGFLWAATFYCLFVFMRSARPDWRQVWAWPEVNWQNLRLILLRFLLAVLAMIAFTAWYDPDRLFVLFHAHPEIIPRILVLYPVLSALPQEFVFCTFFFWRYGTLFNTPRRIILASAAAFAFAHVLFINPVAPPLSLIAGLIFAQTYQKTRSLALVTLEHGLYGNALFLIGLGWYFYHGAIPS